VAGLRAKEADLNQGYLWHWLDNATPKLKEKARGATFLQVSKKDIGSLQIPLPPLVEQQRIAAILDKADAVRKKRQQALALTDELLQATFLDMFGDPVTNPKGWEVGRFGDSIANGPTNGISKTKEFLGRGVSLLDNKGLYKSMWADFSDLRLIEVSRKELAKYRLVNRDVIVNRVSVKPEGVGLPVMVRTAPAECVFESNMMRVTLDSAVMDPVFLVFCLRTNGMRKRTINASNLANQASINQAGLRSLKIIRPPLDLQHRFAQIVESVEQQKATQRADLAELDTLFNALMQRAFRGELSEAVG